MLKLKDKNKKIITGLTNYKDLCIESTLSTGDKKLSFSLHKKDKFYNLIEEECYIETKTQEYVIKARDVGVNYTRFDCVLNLEELEANVFDRFESVEQPITASLNLAIVGTGWTVKDNTLKKKRTVRCTNKNALEIVQEIKKTYRVDIVFNTLKKQIEVYEHLGEDKGTYFIDSLNLIALQIQSDSYKFATRIIAEGKDGLTFEDINNGKNYVENYQYSKKVKTLYWKDERYTIKESLLEDAKAKLREISKPFISYNASVLNLAELNPKYKDILDYKLGDTITLISKNNKVKDKQRIVKTVEYPQDHSRDTVELANAILKFEDVQQENQETTDTVSNITVDNGTVDGSTIDSITTKQIEDFEANVIKVAKLKAILAEIENLHVNKADIQNLNAVIARIGTLEATKASITELNAIHAIIQQIKAGKADITDLNAAVGKINVLESKTASIENALAGNLTAENFKANSITATSGIIAEGAIGSAQISSLSVNKLEAGEFITSKHKIVSADGTIEIVGNQILINRNNVNRVILGEYRRADGTTEYGLLVRAKDGQTIMLDGNGVHNSGITDGAIDNNKVADNANISGNKLDINSVIREVNNNGTETIKGTKVTVGDRTLDVELSTQKNTITEHGKELSSQKATIQALDSAIKLKVDSQTFTQSTQTINSNITRAKEEAINTANSNTTNAINNIQIGGENLVSNLSENWEIGSVNQGVIAGSTYTQLKYSMNNRIRVKELIEVNDIFCISYNNDIFSCCIALFDSNKKYLGRVAGFIDWLNYGVYKHNSKIKYIAVVAKFKNEKNITLNDLEELKLKIEVGNKATGFSLSLEDLKKYSDDVAKAKSDLAKTEAIANADGKITEEERKRIQQAQENLNLAIAKAEKAKQDAINTASTDATNKANNALNSAKAYTNTEITTVNTHLNKATAEINVLKEKIELKVGQSDIDKSIEDVKFGDRNLFPESYLGSHGCAMGKWNNPYMNIPTYNIVVNRPNQGNNFGFNIKKPIKINGGKGVTFTFLFNYIINKYTNSNSSNMHGYTRVYYKDGSKQDFDFNSKIVNCNDKSNWGKWISLKFTFTTDINKEIDNIGLFYFYTDGASEGTNFDFTIPKLVIGNKIGDWTPAPEDTDQLIIDNIKTVTDKISTVESNLTQKTNSIEAGVRDLNSTTQNITTNVSNINRDLTSKINSNLNAAKSFATDIATNKANTAKQEAISSANSHADSIAASKANEALNNSKAYTNAQINTVNTKVHNVESNLNILSNEIKSKVSQSDMEKSISNITIGGRNLALGTSLNYSNPYSRFDGEVNKCPSVAKVITDGLKVGDIVTVRLLYKYENIIQASGKTNSAWLQGAGDVTGWGSGAFSGSVRLNNFSGNGTYEFLYSFTVTKEHMKNNYWDVNLRHDYILSGSVCWKMFKVEKGNKATDWTPAPEDTNSLIVDSIKVINSKISDVSSSVTQLRDSVTTDIRAINSKTQSIETTLNGKASKQEVTEVNNRVATIKASLDSITQRVSSTESKTQTLETNLNGKASKQEVNNVSSKVVSLEANLNGITNRVSSTESRINTLNGQVANATTKQEFTEFKQSTNKFILDIQQSGNENLCTNGGFESNDTNIVKSKSAQCGNAMVSGKVNEIIPQDGGNFFFIDTNGGDAYALTTLSFMFEEGQTYTISVDCRYASLGGKITGSSFVEYWGNYSRIWESQDFGYNWHRVSSTWTAPAGHGAGRAFIRFGIRCDKYAWGAFDNVKVEKGTMATGYTSPGNSICGNTITADKDKLRCQYEDGAYTQMGRNGFEWWKNGMAHPYHCLITQGVINHLSFNGGNYHHRVYLPPEFRGKHFKVQTMIQGWNFPSGSVSGTMASGYQDLDYTNGQFTIYFNGGGDWKTNCNIAYVVIA